MEKRAFKRRILRLKGVCSASGKGNRIVEIRDFCPGGMLLTFKAMSSPDNSAVYTPAQGDVVDIRCNVPSFHTQKPIVFQGRIVRVDTDGAGLAFIDPDLDALHSLHNFTKQRSDASSGTRQQVSPNSDFIRQSDSNKQTLLASCRQMSMASVQSLIDGFFAQAPERLMNAGQKAASISDKNAFYDALTMLSQHQESLKNKFTASTNQWLNHTPELIAAQAKPAYNDPAKMTLSLVEDDVFEEWLAFSDMARKAESACVEQLSDLTHRIGVLFHAPVDKETNPFGPVAFGKAFQDVIRELGFAPGTLHLLYAVYRDELIKHLDTLYKSLNEYLIQNGVLADLRHKLKVKRVAETASEMSKTGEAFVPEIGQVPVQETAPVSPRGALISPPRGVAEEQSWYQLVQNINDLQKQVTAQVSRATQKASASVVQETAEHEPGFYTPQELIGALSRLGSPKNAGAHTVCSPQNIRSQLLSVLTTGKSGHEQKQLPNREEKILDMASNLLESVLSDKLISNNVRPWLQQLSIPIFKMALSDESIFTDKSHLVRQVINAIAQLEFYGAEDGDIGQQAVATRIEGLLSDVEKAEPLTSKVFSRVFKELSTLINIQNKAYEENFQEVLIASEAEQREAQATGIPTASLIPIVGEDSALREWKKRVRRLKLGDSLLLDAESKPRRLRLAWMSENCSRFVFVNVKGLKELAISRDQLAQGLFNGSLIVLDDGGDSLLDRAQYSMLQKMHSHLLHETTHDQLTGLINRREFERRLSSALANAREKDLHHVVCYLDLTQFSVVNNTFGYDGGDRLLAEIAELFDSQLGDRGILARIGGDEFGLLLEDCTIKEAMTLMTRYKDAMQNYRFTVEDKSLAISFSAGLVSLTEESDSIITLLQSAETCCRIARGKGSNYIQLFSADDTGLFRHMEVLKWVTKIDDALDNESLDLRHQPIVGIKDGSMSVHHSEILLGLLNDEGEMISPADFVLAAEHFRRMAAVDRWVIERAFRWMVDNPERLEEIGGLAINLSGSSLNEEGFVDFILAQSLRLKVPMNKVCFEITETAGIANLSNASEFILAVKKTGCQFSLDDFGSGLSSYAYLKNLPVDFLKIDGMFIKSMDSNPYDYAVVKSITEIGHFMGKEIIAEFVENEDILKMLREIGVDYAQGYTIARPQSLAALGQVPLPRYNQ